LGHSKSRHSDCRIMALEDLWGPATLTYELDIGWVFNYEYLEPAGEDGWARAVRLASEKNRYGPHGLEWKYNLHVEWFFLQSESQRMTTSQSLQLNSVRGNRWGIRQMRDGAAEVYAWRRECIFR
jgi:hypothetical protein